VSDPFWRLIQRLAFLEATVVDLQRQVNNTFREAKVLELFPEEGLARVEAHGAKSKKVPWLQRAGSIRDWDPPEPGERVILLSPTGEPGKGLILPGGYSDQYGQPHDKAKEARRIVDDGTSILSTKTQHIIESQLIILRGHVKIEGPRVEHNQRNIGDTHRHEDAGGTGLSGIPPLPG
jgi:phage baseplate assembly protein V